MHRRTQKAIRSSPEWEWWNTSLNLIPDETRRIHYKKRVLYALAKNNDASGYWREQMEYVRERYELPKKQD